MHNEVRICQIILPMGVEGGTAILPRHHSVTYPDESQTDKEHGSPHPHVAQYFLCPSKGLVNFESQHVQSLITSLFLIRGGHTVWVPEMGGEERAMSSGF